MKQGLSAASGGTHSPQPLLQRQRGAGNGKATHDTHVHRPPREPSSLAWGEAGAVVLGQEDAPVTGSAGSPGGSGISVGYFGDGPGWSPDLEACWRPGGWFPRDLCPQRPAHQSWSSLGKHPGLWWALPWVAAFPRFGRVEDAPVAHDSTPSHHQQVGCEMTLKAVMSRAGGGSAGLASCAAVRGPAAPRRPGVVAVTGGGHNSSP